MNTKFITFVTGAALALALAATAPAAAYNSVNAGRATIAPYGAKVFCVTNPRECRGGGAAQVKLTHELLNTLKQVTAGINRSIKPRNESVDAWTLNPSYGDCEDYALSKRSALMRMGVPGNALRIATTTTRRGEPHAVLIVKTNEGDLVLDNLNSAVTPIAAAGYRIRTMSTGSLRSWVKGS